MKKIGYDKWRKEKLHIQGFPLTHELYIGTTDKTKLSSTTSVVRTFKSKYAVKTNHPITYLEFALKYHDFKLAFR
ncbi:MAG: hypothetical protein I4O51_12620 [Flavobacterium micromati]|nr:hypothetical protein [Flavobacterium micromati]